MKSAHDEGIFYPWEPKRNRGAVRRSLLWCMMTTTWTLLWIPSVVLLLVAWPYALLFRVWPQLEYRIEEEMGHPMQAVVNLLGVISGEK